MKTGNRLKQITHKIVSTERKEVWQIVLMICSFKNSNDEGAHHKMLKDSLIRIEAKEL